ncbi:hypothetical protein EYC80_004876 [Monilinia laxa]|uniref:Homeobox domain-containing protein n=1 Tax=Monilinia laxa TaxID=61186 RepID=A0A5N6KI59_MONLA|nr:hypothetical protein EYC80_004876 [Monilinia laxa]
MTPPLLPKIHSSQSALHVSRDSSPESSLSLPQKWSRYERNQFLVILCSAKPESDLRVELASPEREFEFISQELASEETHKTPQECREFYDELVKKGSIAKTMEKNKNTSMFLESYLIPVNNNTGDHQEQEEHEKKLQVDALSGDRDVMRKPIFQDKKERKSAWPHRRPYFWSAEEDKCLYKEYKAHFENGKTDKRSAKEIWDSIGRNLQAQGFRKRSREACILHWTKREERSPGIPLTEAQQDELEVAYKVNERLVNEENSALAERLELPIKEVKKWFESKSGSVLGRTSSVNSRGRPRKRQRQSSSRNEKSCSISPTTVPQMSQMIASAKSQSINSEATGRMSISTPVIPEFSDPEIEFSARFADLRTKERQRLQSKYEESQELILRIGNDVKSYESEARKNLLAIQKEKRTLDKEGRKLVLLRKKIESLDMVSC